MKSRLYIATLGAAALLGACGGGSDDLVATTPPAPAPAPATTVPDSAGASADAFITFLTGLALSDTTEPLELGTFDPTPTLSETTEPVAITSSS